MPNQRSLKRRRTGLAIAALAISGAGASGGIVVIGSPGMPASRSAVVLVASHGARNGRASKPATLPQCGATRDPFDPTGSTGSGAC